MSMSNIKQLSGRGTVLEVLIDNHGYPHQALYTKTKLGASFCTKGTYGLCKNIFDLNVSYLLCFIKS